MKTAICCSFLRETGIFPPWKEKKTVVVKEESQRVTSPASSFLKPFPTRPEWKRSAQAPSSCLLGPHRAPRGKSDENRANREPSWAECVYSTSFSDATTSLIAEKQMTSLVWPGASAVALWRGLRCPCARSHTASIQAPGAAFLSRVNSAKANTRGRDGSGLE